MSNGIKARQTTVTINGDRVTTGYYSYIENGQTYTVNYVADRNGYRASGAHLPVQPLSPQQQNFGYPGYPSSTPAPFGPSYSSSTFGPSYPSSTPSPFGPSYPASTPAPFRPSYSPSTPFAPSYPSTTPIPIIPSSPYPNNGRPPPTSIYVPSSTPFNRPGMAAVVIPIVSFHNIFSLSVPSGAYLPPSSTPFPIYQQSYPPFPGYQYQNPRPSLPGNPYQPNYQPSNNNNNFNNYNNYQTPAPVFYSTTPPPFPSSSSLPPITSFAARRPSIDDYSRVSTTLAPPLIRDVPPSTISTILDENASPLPLRNRYIPSDFDSSTPRPFNNNGVTPVYQQPDTVYITPKTYYNQRLPNSLAINQNLLPPYLNVNGLDDADNGYRRGDFQVSGPSVRPLHAGNNYNTYQPNDYKK